MHDRLDLPKSVRAGAMVVHIDPPLGDHSRRQRPSDGHGRLAALQLLQLRRCSFLGALLIRMCLADDVARTRLTVGVLVGLTGIVRGIAVHRHRPGDYARDYRHLALLGFVEPIRDHQLIVVALLDRDPAATVFRITNHDGRQRRAGDGLSPPLGTTTRRPSTGFATAPSSRAKRVSRFISDSARWSI